METSLMVHDYPEPPEEKDKTIRAQITLTFEIEDEVPERWESDDIKEYIKENLSDYIGLYDYKEIEIEV